MTAVLKPSSVDHGKTSVHAALVSLDELAEQRKARDRLAHDAARTLGIWLLLRMAAGASAEHAAVDGRSGAAPVNLLTSLARFGLTSRESGVMLLLVEGLTNRQIAERLAVSPRTVEKHVERLLQKTDAPNRSALVALALRSRTVLPPRPDRAGAPRRSRTG